MDQSLVIVNNRGERLAATLSHPDGPSVLPVVVICHGFGGGKDAGLIPRLVRRLDDLGIGTLRFDFAGHGASEGDIAETTIARGVEDLRAAIDTLAEQSWIDRSRLGLVGYSFGGAVALRYAAEHNRVKALGLIAPVADYAAVKEKKHGRAGIERWKAEGSIEEDTDAEPVRLAYQFYEDARSHDTFALARSLDLDVLLVVGARDDVAPREDVERLADALGPRARLLIVPNADHGFEEPARAEAAVAALAELFGERLGVLN
jgi:uncharacterized protein